MKHISKKELLALYESKTNDEVCKILGISKATLIKYLRESDIPLKGKGGGLSSSKYKIY